MALTYTTLCNALKTYTQNYNADFVAALPTIVQQAEDRIFKAVQIPALKKNQAGATTAANRFLTLPTDYLATYSASVTSGSTTSYMLEREVSWISEALGGVANGLPRYYAQFDENTYLLGPTPAAAYAVELHYFYRPSSIVDTGTSWLGTNAESVLLYASLVEAYTFMKGEADLMQLYQARMSEAMVALKNLGEGRDKTDNFKTDAPRSQPA